MMDLPYPPTNQVQIAVARVMVCQRLDVFNAGDQPGAFTFRQMTDARTNTAWGRQAYEFFQAAERIEWPRADGTNTVSVSFAMADGSSNTFLITNIVKRWEIVTLSNLPAQSFTLWTASNFPPAWTMAGVYTNSPAALVFTNDGPGVFYRVAVP